MVPGSTAEVDRTWKVQALNFPRTISAAIRHIMAKNRDQKNNFRAAVDAAKTAFGEVKNAAKAYEAAEASEKEKRLELLEAMYSFVESRRSDQKEVLKAFVRENNEKWAKPAEKNPYQPIAKIVFPNKAASTHTWYSQVLGYASNSNVQPGTLADWLKQHEGGMEGAYKAAVTHFGSGRIKGGAAYRSERLDRARDKFGKAEVSTSFKMTAPVDIESGFVVALLRVDAGGEARVVEIVEQDQQAVEETLLRYVQVDEVVDNALKGKPLYELYRAVHLIHGIVPTEESDTERLILVINGAKSGKEKTRLFSASRSLNQV